MRPPVAGLPRLCSEALVNPGQRVLENAPFLHNHPEQKATAPPAHRRPAGYLGSGEDERIDDDADASLYGRRLVVCPACAAALQGQDYKCGIPESAARTIRRGAA